MTDPATNTGADLASALAHRACCSEEHDAARGKLHGWCVVCGVPWPCETAEFFLRKAPSPSEPQAQPNEYLRSALATLRLAKPDANDPDGCEAHLTPPEVAALCRALDGGIVGDECCRDIFNDFDHNEITHLPRSVREAWKRGRALELPHQATLAGSGLTKNVKHE